MLADDRQQHGRQGSGHDGRAMARIQDPHGQYQEPAEHDAHQQWEENPGRHNSAGQ